MALSQRDLAPTILLLLLLSLEWLALTSYPVTVDAATSNPPQGQQQQPQRHKAPVARDHRHRDYYAIQIQLPLGSTLLQQQTPLRQPHLSHASKQDYDQETLDRRPYHHHHHHQHHHDRQHPARMALQGDMEQWLEALTEQAHAIGQLLDLQLECRVGSLPDYFLYSRPKPFQPSSPENKQPTTTQDEGSDLALSSGGPGLVKRSVFPDEPWDVGQGQVGEGTVTLAAPASAVVVIEKVASAGDGEAPGLSMAATKQDQEENEGFVDPVVERFYALKVQYAASSWSSGSGQRGQSHRFAKRDLTAATVQTMKTIYRQELRWRVKKRAPLPDPLPPPIVPQIQEEGGKGNKEATKKKNKNKHLGATVSDKKAGKQQQQQQKEKEEDEKGGDEEEEVQDIVAEDEPEETDEEQEQPQVSNGTTDQQETENVEDQHGAAKSQPSKVEAPAGNNGYDTPVGEAQPDDGLARRLNITDPGFQYQWHLHNTVNEHDINVIGVWEQGINGTGVNVAIIDDGLDANNKDLSENFFAQGSWDFNDHTALPLPRLSDDLHGTRCAGEIAAARNDMCGVGVAFGAKVAGLRILSGQITDVDEAAALNYQFHDNHIYSCSWGPPDDGQSMDGPKGVVLDAITNGIAHGRDGKGSIFVFATGNGGSYGDDCNFDGYTNSLYTVSIGAIDRQGRHPYYSEACSAQLAVTYSNGGGSAIYTCDVGEHKCFANHGGTSAAAPIAAGMIALALSARPDLTWRDVQALLIQTARPVSTDDEDWKPTAAGRLFNHKFGYGRLDAFALVEAAKTFQNLGPQVRLASPVLVVEQPIPQETTEGISASFEVKSTAIVPAAEDDNGDGPAVGARLGKLEHVTVTVNIAHERRGDVAVTLISPLGIKSHLGVPRRFDESKDGFVDWTFMTVKHWGEEIVGTWTLQVHDNLNPSFQGTFINWKIQFWGEAADPTQEADVPVESKVESLQQEKEEGVGEDGEEKGREGGKDQEPPQREMFEQEQEATKTTKTPTPSTTLVSEGLNKLEDEPKNTSEKGHDPESLPEAAPGLEQEKGSVVDNLMEAIADPEDGSVANAQDEEVLASRAGRAVLFFGSVISVGGCAVLVLFSKRRWDGRGRYTSVSNTDRGLAGMNEVDSLSLLPRTNAEATSVSRRGAGTSETARADERGQGRGTGLSRVLRGAVDRMSSPSRAGSRRDVSEQRARLARELLDPLESSPSHAQDKEECQSNSSSDTDGEDDWMEGSKSSIKATG